MFLSAGAPSLTRLSLKGLFVFIFPWGSLYSFYLLIKFGWSLKWRDGRVRMGDDETKEWICGGRRKGQVVSGCKSKSVMSANEKLFRLKIRLDGRQDTANGCLILSLVIPPSFSSHFLSPITIKSFHFCPPPTLSLSLSPSHPPFEGQNQIKGKVEASKKWGFPNTPECAIIFIVPGDQAWQI